MSWFLLTLIEPQNAMSFGIVTQLNKYTTDNLFEINNCEQVHHEKSAQQMADNPD